MNSVDNRHPESWGGCSIHHRSPILLHAPFIHAHITMSTLYKAYLVSWYFLKKHVPTPWLELNFGWKRDVCDCKVKCTVHANRNSPSIATSGFRQAAQPELSHYVVHAEDTKNVFSTRSPSGFRDPWLFNQQLCHQFQALFQKTYIWDAYNFKLCCSHRPTNSSTSILNNLLMRCPDIKALLRAQMTIYSSFPDERHKQQEAPLDSYS